MTITVRVALALTSAAGLLAALPVAPAHAAVTEIQLADTGPSPVTAGAVTLRRTTSASINLLQASVAVAPDGTQLQYTAARDVVNGQGVTTMQPRRIGLLNPVTGAETVIRPATGTARSVHAGGLTAGWAVWAEGGRFLPGDSTDVRVLAYNRTTGTTTVLRQFTVQSPGRQFQGDTVAVLGDRAYWAEWQANSRVAIFSRALTGVGPARLEVAGAGQLSVDQCSTAAGTPALVYGVSPAIGVGTPNGALVVHRRVVAGPQAGTDTVLGRFTVAGASSFADPVACAAAIGFTRQELIPGQLAVRRVVRLVADGRTVDLVLPQGFQGFGLTLTAQALGLAGRGFDFPGGQYLYHRARQTAYSFGPAVGVQQSGVPTARVLMNGTAVSWRGLSGLSFTTSVGRLA